MTAVLRRHDSRACGTADDEMTFFVISEAGHPAAVGARSCGARAASRSEEHTSELQSRPHLVCRLLLEKKNVLGAGHQPDPLLKRIRLTPGRHIISPPRTQSTHSDAPPSLNAPSKCPVVPTRYNPSLRR